MIAFRVNRETYYQIEVIRLMRSHPKLDFVDAHKIAKYRTAKRFGVIK